MKKLLAILLSMVMLLSLAACGEQEEDDDSERTEKSTTEETKEDIFFNDNPEETVEILTGEPTAEEWDAIDKYGMILEELNNYIADGYIYIEYADFGVESDVAGINGNEALAFCYDQLTKLGAMDKWVGSEYMDESWNRQETLNAFAIVEDVRISETRSTADYLGNWNTDLVWGWEYNADGTLLTTNARDWFDRSEHPWKDRSFAAQVIGNPASVLVGAPFYRYGANGQVERIEYCYSAGDAVNVASELTYTGDLLTGEHIMTADGESYTVTYAYNDKNQVSEIIADCNGIRYVYTYQYNDRGQVVSERVLVEQEDYYDKNTYNFYCEAVTNYTYDSNGHLSQGVCVHTQNWDNRKATTTDQWTYVCDAQGRIVTVDMTCGDIILETGEVARAVDQPFAKAEYAYGDFYNYNP